jgi:hypothetical protein
MESPPAYTKEDMRTLVKMSAEGSIAEAYLPDLDYDPEAFQSLLRAKGLNKDVHYLFEVPLEDVPLIINRGDLSGYMQFRMTVYK